MRRFRCGPLAFARGVVTAVPAVAAAHGGAWALTNARIETVTRGVTDRDTIVMRDGFIEAVGASIPVPPDARVVRLSDRTVHER